jgi:hypothetical protein
MTEKYKIYPPEGINFICGIVVCKTSGMFKPVTEFLNRLIFKNSRTENPRRTGIQHNPFSSGLYV